MKERLIYDDCDRLMSLDEVAARLKTSSTVVSRIIKAGLLTTLKLGPYKRVRKTTFNEFLRQYDGKDLTEVLEGAETK